MLGKWKTRAFNGYHREDGKVGTANYVKEASGDETKAMKLDQNDFIPCKRGVFL